MTPTQQDILIAKIVDAPETLTPEEISMIEQDSELMDLYEMNSILRGAYQPEVTINPDHEWEKFVLRTSMSQRPWHFSLLKMTAAIAGVILITGIVMMIVGNAITLDKQTYTQDNRHLSARIITTAGDIDVQKDTTTTEYDINIQSPIKIPHQSPHKTKCKHKVDTDKLVRLAIARINNDNAMKIAQIELSEQILFHQANNELHMLYPDDNSDIDVSTTAPDIAYSLML